MEFHRKRALEGLREIYQQEKDWTRCLEVAGQLQRLTGESVGAESAQYHCELAEESLKYGHGSEAVTHLNHARTVDPDCVRATVLQARIAMGQDDSQGAAVLYRRVARQGLQFLSEILPDLVTAYRRSGLADELGELKCLYRICPTPTLVMMLADTIQKREGDEAAIAFLTEHVTGHADLAGLERLLALYAPKLVEDAQTQAVFHAAQAVIDICMHAGPITSAGIAVSSPAGCVGNARAVSTGEASNRSNRNPSATAPMPRRLPRCPSRLSPSPMG